MAPAFIETLRNDSEANLRLRAIAALEESQDERAITPLIEAAKSDPNREVRSRALVALRAFDNERAAAALIEFLRREYKE